MWYTTMNLMFTLYFNLNNSNNPIAQLIHVLRPFVNQVYVIGKQEIYIILK